MGCGDNRPRSAATLPADAADASSGHSGPRIWTWFAAGAGAADGSCVDALRDAGGLSAQSDDISGTPSSHGRAIAPAIVRIRALSDCAGNSPK